MFHLTTCTHEGCDTLTLNINGNTFGDRCAVHLDSEGRRRASSATFEYIRTHDKIIGINASGLVFENWDVSGKGFYGCSFVGCRFTNFIGKNCTARMVCFDFTTFADCDFTGTNAHFVSFAGCRFDRTKFSGTDLIHDNFNGVIAVDSSLSDSNLYNSRFIGASLTNTNIKNCLITGVDFSGLVTTNVSFKLSNTREAIFDPGASPE